jgi:hypothetical protein
MAERDPRTDPQPGDVVESGPTQYRTTYTVTRRFGDLVDFVWGDGAGSHRGSVPLHRWIDPTDTVIYTSPTPSAPLPASPDAQTESSGDGQADPLPSDVDALAEVIRRVDGDHKLGAGTLAERILEHWGPAQIERRLVAVERVAARHPEAVRLLRLMLADPDNYATVQAVTAFLAGVGP